MTFPATLPQVGQGGQVRLNNIDLMVVPGTYRVEEAPGFGEKIQLGELTYADLSPDVSAHSIVSLTSGYGLRRYSDMPPGDRRRGQCYLESTDVDCRNIPVILGPLQTAQALTGIAATPVWGGEFVASDAVRYFVVVAGTKVWKSADLLTWTDTGLALAATPVQGAVGVFGGKLLFGYGSAAVAQWTRTLSGALNNVTDDAGPPVNIFVFAFTADRAAAYIAGGTAAANVNKVMSSGDQTTTTFKFEIASIVTCGSVDNAITALAPGGGLVTVYVGKTTELAEIDNSGVYRTLVPFDSYLATNCVGMRWWLGSAGDEQRGPIILIFPRDRSTWAFEPSSETSGRAENISPWADMNHRPPTIRGRTTAIQGSARWLYYAIQSNAGNSWIIARDARTGANHPIVSLGANDCRMLAISSLGGSPKLLIGKGNGLVTCVLPIDGEMPLDEAAYRYAASGVLTLPDIDLNFPAEDKISLSIVGVAEDVAVGRTIQIEAAYDGGAYSVVGTVDAGPLEEFDFSPPTTTKRISLRLTFATNDSTKTPRLLALILRLSLNPKLYRLWNFTAPLPAGSLASLSDDLRNPRDTIIDLWSARARGTPVPFEDRWNDSYTVRIRQINEQEIIRETDRTPETHLAFVLLSTTAVSLIGVQTGTIDALGSLTIDGLGSRTIDDLALIAGGG